MASVSAQAGLEMRLDQEKSLDITPFVKRFVWRQSMIAGGFSWEMRFATTQWNEWNALLMGRERPRVQFRLRSDESDQQPQATEWRTVITDMSRASFSQDISMIGEIRGADRRLELAQETRCRVFDTQLASSVFSRIASEYGLDTDIEPTSVADTFTQAHKNDWTFMRGLARDHVVQSKRGDCYLWLDENILKFQTVELSDQSDRSYDIATLENRVNGYAATYYGRRADRRGAARLQGIGFDFVTKKPVVFTMDPGAAQTHPSLAQRVPRRMADGLRVFPVIESTPGLVEAETRARWGRVAPRYLSLAIETRPDLTVRVGKIMSVESNLGERRETPFLGRYAILEVEHVYEDGAISTKLIGYRREAHEGEAQPTGSSADNVGTRDRNGLVSGINPRTTVIAQEIQ